MKQTWGLP